MLVRKENEESPEGEVQMNSSIIPGPLLMGCVCSSYFWPVAPCWTAAQTHCLVSCPRQNAEDLSQRALGFGNASFSDAELDCL